MFLVYLFYAELIILPLLLLAVLFHQRSKMRALAFQLAGLEAQLATAPAEIDAAGRQD